MPRHSMMLPGPNGRPLIEPAAPSPVFRVSARLARHLAEHQTDLSNRHLRFVTLKAHETTGNSLYSNFNVAPKVRIWEVAFGNGSSAGQPERTKRVLTLCPPGTAPPRWLRDEVLGTAPLRLQLVPNVQASDSGEACLAPTKVLQRRRQARFAFACVAFPPMPGGCPRGTCRSNARSAAGSRPRHPDAPERGRNSRRDR